MNTRNATARQATAFGLAALVTLSMLASVNLLATQPVAEQQMARKAAPTQMVVIQDQRAAQV